jgi:HEPN domain-containing protein
MILGLSIPIWLDKALPIMKDYLNTARVKLENGYAFLKFIAGQVAELFMRLLERYVLKSG